MVWGSVFIYRRSYQAFFLTFAREPVCTTNRQPICPHTRASLLLRESRNVAATKCRNSCFHGLAFLHRVLLLCSVAVSLVLIGGLRQFRRVQASTCGSDYRAVSTCRGKADWCRHATRWRHGSRGGSAWLHSRSTRTHSVF